MGPVNDWTMWQRSGVESAVREVIGSCKALYLFGDPAYRASYGVACPFEDPCGRGFLPDDKAAFNAACRRSGLLLSKPLAIYRSLGLIQPLAKA